MSLDDEVFHGCRIWSWLVPRDQLKRASIALPRAKTYPTGNTLDRSCSLHAWGSAFSTTDSRVLYFKELSYLQLPRTYSPPHVRPLYPAGVVISTSSTTSSCIVAAECRDIDGQGL